jgi:maltose-binding protein MalE
MMKMNKTCAVIGSAMMLSVCLLTGCGKSGGKAAGTSGAVDYAEHETFTAWLYATPNDFYSSYSDNPIVRYLNNKFNVTLEFEQPAAGTEQDSLSLMFGTGEYTDMIDMAYYAGSITELYENGVIVDIAQYLDYMPNFKALLDKYEVFRKVCYDDKGRILTLRQMMAEEEVPWGGLVYRRDILDAMTGGNIAFPSGNEHPSTVDDWEYMLPLFKAYFQAAGMADYAPLIIPYNGYFVMGDLVSGFGINNSYYIDNNKVLFGPIEEGFYNYIEKMREWYAAGYIYKDFASRVNDLFYLPNTALTYGGAAGVWFGFYTSLGDNMSMPEYGLYFDVRPMTGPMDTAHGVEEVFPYLPDHPQSMSGGNTAISAKCGNIPKLLSVLDFMYGEKGSMFRQYGLALEDGAADDPVYKAAGLEKGAYWFEGDTLVRNPKMWDGSFDGDAMLCARLGALGNNHYTNLALTPEEKLAAVWRKYGDSKRFAKLPPMIFSAEDGKAWGDNTARVTEYLDASIPKYIMGTEPFNRDVWNQFVSRIKALGVEENIRIAQSAYDNYLKR